MVNFPKEFVEKWAKEAWDTEIGFNGTLSGGIDPIKRMVLCNVEGNTVKIKYVYPETCGLSDVIYHVTDPYRVRTDIFEFKENGELFMNGKPFPGECENDFLLEDEAREFNEKYAAALKELKQQEGE